MENVRLFNTVFDKFVDDLIIFFPENTKLKVYKNKFLAARKINVTSPVNIFFDTFGDSGTHIMSEDIEYFKNDMRFQNELGIFENWDQYSDDKKTIVWQYMKSLYIICNKALGVSS